MNTWRIATIGRILQKSHKLDDILANFSQDLFLIATQIEDQWLENRINLLQPTDCPIINIQV